MSSPENLYRQNLAKKLSESPKSKRREALEEAKKSPEYQKAKHENINQRREKDYNKHIQPILESLQIDPNTLEQRLEGEDGLKDRITQAEQLARALVDKHGKLNFDNNFTRDLIFDLERKDSKLAPILSERLEGEIVVDLGCSYSDYGVHTVAQFKPLAYVGVDKYSHSSLKDNPEMWDKKMQTKIAFVPQDMLVFVSQLPDNSVNFMINGIDEFIIPDEDYWKRLVKEMKRALKPGGVIFGTGSILPKFADPDLKDLSPEEKKNLFFGAQGNFIFEK